MTLAVTTSQKAVNCDFPGDIEDGDDTCSNIKNIASTV